MDAFAAADQVWAAALIFARLGAVMLLLPGIGESYVPPRIRLSLALVMTLALWPVLTAYLPPLPDTVSGTAGWIIREVLVGLAIGSVLRAFMTALAYYDGYRHATLPANLLQAQRDYFGAHTYERTDKPGTYHTEWLDLRKPVA